MMFFFKEKVIYLLSKKTRMKKLNKAYISFFVLLFGLLLISTSCEKDNSEFLSNDGLQARKAYTDKGYREVAVSPIVKISCYFDEWDKIIMTPVSGFLEYYDLNNNWIASIDFGDGACDEWATKTWDITVFPDYPSGSEDFSVFDYKFKKSK